jgi:hypothetical protein
VATHEIVESAGIDGQPSQDAQEGADKPIARAADTKVRRQILRRFVLEPRGMRQTAKLIDRHERVDVPAFAELFERAIGARLRRLAVSARQG